MENAGVNQQRKHGLISYISIVIGIICFFIVFVTPTRIANTGNATGDYITLILTIVGIIISMIGLLKRSEKPLLPFISLFLSSSNIIFWIVTLILLFTHQIDFAP